MKYHIYTDAATKIQEGYSSIAFIVLCDNIFVKAHRELVHEKSTSVAESLAMGLAIKYIVNELDILATDETKIFCDSIYTVRFARRRNNKQEHKEDSSFICKKPYNAYWLLDIYDYLPLIKGKVKIVKITSHKDEFNPNCYVDRLAKAGLLK